MSDCLMEPHSIDVQRMRPGFPSTYCGSYTVMKKIFFVLTLVALAGGLLLLKQQRDDVEEYEEELFV